MTYDDGTTTGTYGYDDVARKLTETVNYGLFSLNHSYVYYKNGRKKRYTGPDGVTIEYDYDNNNQLSRIGIPEQGPITTNRHHWYAPEKITLPGGSTRLFEYDPFMRPTRILANDPAGNAILDYRYAYDEVNNIIEKITEQGEYR